MFTIEGERFTCAEVQRARVTFILCDAGPIAYVQNEQAALRALLRIRRASRTLQQMIDPQLGEPHE